MCFINEIIKNMFVFRSDMEFKTRVKDETDVEVWEASEAYDVRIINIYLSVKVELNAD